VRDGKETKIIISQYYFFKYNVRNDRTPMAHLRTVIITKTSLLLAAFFFASLDLDAIFLLLLPRRDSRDALVLDPFGCKMECACWYHYGLKLTGCWMRQISVLYSPKATSTIIVRPAICFNQCTSYFSLFLTRYFITHVLISSTTIFLMQFRMTLYS
jgi:hypothetical protein